MEKKDKKKTIKNTKKTPKAQINNVKGTTKTTKKSTEDIKNPTEIANKIDKSDDKIVKDDKKINKDLEIQTTRDKELLIALKEISKGEGIYSTDKLKHAENTIEDMKKIAIDALNKYENSLT